MEIKWNRYINAPFKHLGEDLNKGIDCFNLIALIYEEQLNINIPYRTKECCDIINTDWYNKTHDQLINKIANGNYGWKKIYTPELYSVITMTLGTSNITNHCALYLGDNKMLHTYINNKSQISIYGGYYKQYTTGIYKWIGMIN
tara:strand:+ start:671 stop:1102 length:432 start_codon:yes stop_codon:yes gene_type:complete